MLAVVAELNGEAVEKLVMDQLLKLWGLNLLQVAQDEFSQSLLLSGDVA